MVGSDFTASNIEATKPNSLHYINGNQPNSYERAIRACGNILAYYDSDQSYPLFGFGGVPKGKSSTDHAFPLNFSSNPCVNGIDEIIDVYKNAVIESALSGPTNFSPLINNLCEFVSKAPEGIYFVMMILTDGDISDMDETIDAIVNASKLPLSIIIIGVGNSSFNAMNQLDGDEMPLTNSSGKCAERDIVQFVPFSKYESDSSKLAEEVLRELPLQIEIYYRNKHLGN